MDIYIDVNQPYPDAMAAYKLCGSKGLYQYKVVANGVSDHDKVVRYVAFHDHHHADLLCSMLQPRPRAEIVRSCRAEYADVHIFEMHNPVQKLTVVSQGSDNEVHMIEIGLDADGERVQIEGRSGNPVDDMVTL